MWLAAIRASDLEQIGFTKDYGRKDVIWNRVRTPDSVEDMILTQLFVDYMAEKKAREQFANFVLPTLKDPGEIWVTAVERQERILYRRRFLSTFIDDNKSMVAVVQESKDGGLAWTFHPGAEKEINRLRQGHLLHRRSENGE